MVLVDYPQVLCDYVVRSIGWQNRGSDDQGRRRNDRGRALGKRFQCQVMLPGVDPGDVNQVLGNTLTIGGERSSTRETKESDYLHRKISYGSFQRLIELPEGVDKDKLTAEYRNGVLEITATISAAALPRKIEVKSFPAPKERAPSSGRNSSDH
jgi:hypothetical protein